MDSAEEEEKEVRTLLTVEDSQPAAIPFISPPLPACAYTYLIRQIPYGHVPDAALRGAIEGRLRDLAAR